MHFAYPELISKQYFTKLVHLGIDSDLMVKIEKNMEKEKEYFEQYKRNSKMYWYRLHVVCLFSTKIWWR